MTETPDNLDSESKPEEVSVEHRVVTDDEVSIQSVSELIYPLFSIEPEIADLCTLRMAGCSIEEVPVLELEYRPELAIDESVTRTLFLSDLGELDDELVASLDLANATSLEKPNSWLRSHGRRERLQQLIESASQTHAELISQQGWKVIWCKHVEGKLLFQMEEDSKEIKFSGWARRFTNGREVCPPFLCDTSGKSSYRVTADDEGDLTIPSAIRTCTLSGKRLIESKVSACTVSEKEVATELLWVCPASGDLLIETLAIPCRQCGQQVSPASTMRGICKICHRMEKVDRHSTEVGEVIRQLPELSRARGWKMAKGERWTVLTCRNWLRRTLIVLGQDNQLLAKREASWFSQVWTDRHD